MSQREIISIASTSRDSSSAANASSSESDPEFISWVDGLAARCFHKQKTEIAPSRGVACNICNQTFSYQSLLTVHMKRHGGRLPYTCETCKVNFRWQMSLRMHGKRCQAAHQKKRRIVKQLPVKIVKLSPVKIVESPPEAQPPAQPPAPAVDQSEVQQPEFQQQPETQHQPEASPEVERQPEPLFKCEKRNCNQIFGSSISLARHSRIHLKSKPEACVFCSRPCAQVHWTRRCCTTAMATRSGKLHKCSICMKLMAKQRHLSL